MDIPRDEGYEPAEVYIYWTIDLSMVIKVVVAQMNEIIRNFELEKKASEDGDIIYDEQTTV